VCGEATVDDLFACGRAIRASERNVAVRSRGKERPQTKVKGKQDGQKGLAKQGELVLIAEDFFDGREGDVRDRCEGQECGRPACSKVGGWWVVL
jgi:hypothetical protein